MVTPQTTVFVIDDDPSFRRSTEMLIESAGLSVQTFNSAEEFLRDGAQTPRRVWCWTCVCLN